MHDAPVVDARERLEGAVRHAERRRGAEGEREERLAAGEGHDEVGTSPVDAKDDETRGALAVEPLEGTRLVLEHASGAWIAREPRARALAYEQLAASRDAEHAKEGAAVFEGKAELEAFGAVEIACHSLFGRSSGACPTFSWLSVMARSILTEVKRSLAFFSVCLFGVAGLLPLIPLSACSNEFPKITNPDASTTDPPVGEDGAIPEEGGVIPLPDGAVDPGVPLTFIRDLTVQIMPSDRGASILDAIRTAKTSIHMEMYLLTNSSVINALKTAKQQGRDVKVVLNQDFPQGGNGNASAFNELKNAGVGVVYAPPAFTFAHAKTIVIDGASGWIMTMNLTQTSPTDNREYLVRVTGAAEVAELEAIFNADFTNKSVDLPGRLVVSPGSATPVDPQKRMVALMRGATSQIDLEGESLSDNQIVETLIAAKKAGRTVRVILNDQESSPGQVTAIAAIKAAGIPIVKVTTPDIHAKAIVVDRARAYVGSQNFTFTSLLKNREVGVLTDNATEVGKMQSTIDADFAKGVSY